MHIHMCIRTKMKALLASAASFRAVWIAIGIAYFATWTFALFRGGDRFDQVSLDALLRRKSVPADTQVAVVAYGDYSLAATNAVGWEQFTTLISLIESQEPAVLALDFASFDAELFRGDTAGVLDSLISFYGNILIGLPCRVPRDGAPVPLSGHPADSPDRPAIDSATFAASKYRAAGWSPMPINGVGKASRAGHLVFTPGPDGIFREVPGWVAMADGAIPAFGLEAARLALTANGGRWRIGKRDMRFMENARAVSLPLDEGGRFRFLSEPSVAKGPRLYAMEEVLHNYGSIDSEGRAGFAGKIVFLGNTSMATGRYVPIPGNPYYPTLLLHAQIAQAVLSGRYLRPLAPAWAWMLLAPWAMLLALLLGIKDFNRLAGTASVCALLVTAAALAAVPATGLEFPLATWLLSAWLLLGIALGGKIVLDRQRYKLEQDALRTAVAQRDRAAILELARRKVGHEIRNQMITISSGLDNLRTHCDASPEARNAYRQVEAGLFELENRSKEMLKAFIAKSTGSPEAVDLRKIIGLSRELYSRDLQKAGIRFRNEVPEGARIMGHEDLAFSVFANLIRNAIEAAPRQGGEIAIARGASAGRVVAITVRDNGSGIPAEHLGLVFEPTFTHGKTDGNGLGLAIVRHIMEIHAGRVTVASQAGIFTEFTLEFKEAEDGKPAGVAGRE